MPVTAPRAPHSERHFAAPDAVRDIVIGMADGLTVPFALAAGLSGAISSTKLIVTAGLAEVVAGSIAMGLGGYLAGRSDAEHYASELARERREIVEQPDDEVREVQEIFARFGLQAEDSARVAQALRANPERWVDFMMQYELGLTAPDPRRALRSALTIATAYAVGGLIPLSPYMVLETAARALLYSVAMTIIALFAFGYVKGHYTGTPPLRSAVQTTAIGGLAAAAAFLIARLIS